MWFIFNTVVLVIIVAYLCFGVYKPEKIKWYIILLAPAFVLFILSWQYLYNDDVGKRFTHYGLPIKAGFNGCYIHATMPPNLAYPEKMELGWYNCDDYDRYVKYFNK